ncbi:MAG: hypothetical protein QXI33_02500 [Candidatus Pacearchaeota archaeon]
MKLKQKLDKICSISIFFLVMLFSITYSYAQAENSTEQAKIYVGIYVLNLGKFDISTGSFTIDFYLSLKCDDICPNQDFEFMNGRAASLEKTLDLPQEKFYRIQANLNSPIDLKRFPFDSQKMQIIIEDKKNTIERLVYVPNFEESGIDDSIAFAGWNIDDWNMETKEHYYPVYDETYSQIIFSIPISKILINSIIKTLLPVIFILLVTLSSFILDTDKIPTRIAMVSSALVASVMFHVSLSNQIPAVSYLTFADKFMVLTYFVLLMSFAFNVLLLELHQIKKDELLKILHSKAKYSSFIIVLALYIMLFILFL